MAARARGVLVVLEGAEGVGKTTQLRRLDRWLTAGDVPHLALREPGGTAVGERIRTVLLDPECEIEPRAEALLFMASRAQLIADQIRPALEAGQVVVLDRFFLSTYAYQIIGRGLAADDVRAANRLATGGLVPDLTLVLDLPIADGLARAAARGAKDRMESADRAFHDRIGAAFATFVGTAWGEAHPESGPIVRIDASGEPDAVFTRMQTALADRLPSPFAALTAISTS